MPCVLRTSWSQRKRTKKKIKKKKIKKKKKKNGVENKEAFEAIVLLLLLHIVCVQVGWYRFVFAVSDERRRISSLVKVCCCNDCCTFLPVAWFLLVLSLFGCDVIVDADGLVGLCVDIVLFLMNLAFVGVVGPRFVHLVSVPFLL